MKTRKCRPIYIGIISAPMPLKRLHKASSYLKSTYLTWVSISGAVPVIIPYDLTPTQLERSLRNINGIVFVGGDIENTKTHSDDQYKTLIKNYTHTFKYAVEETSKGNPFPIWGTCNGFEILGMLGENRRRDFFTPNHLQRETKFDAGPLIFAGPSRLKSAFSANMRQRIANEPVTRHLHNFGYAVDSPHLKELTKYLRVVSIDTDENESAFVNMFEYIDYPFYGSQWHPEMPVSKLSSEVGATLSRFFKKECSNNKNACVPITVHADVLIL